MDTTESDLGTVSFRREIAKERRLGMDWGFTISQFDNLGARVEGLRKKQTLIVANREFFGDFLDKKKGAKIPPSKGWSTIGKNTAETDHVL